MSWLTEAEMNNFKQVGKRVLISREATIHGRKNVSIGDNVRIDAGTIILAGSGYLEIGSHVHVAAQNLFVCGGGIIVEDFCAISFANKIISASDDFSGEHLIGPIVPDDYRKVYKKMVRLRECSALATNCVILPGVVLGEGTVVGSCSFVQQDRALEPWSIFAGVPARRLKSRELMQGQLASQFSERYK